MNTNKSMLDQIDGLASFRHSGTEQKEIPHLLRDRYRKNALGWLGEDLAEQALWRNNFGKVENLNRTRKHNYEFADILAERNGQTYFIGVKTRNEMQTGGIKINGSYNLVLINDAANNRLKSEGNTEIEITKLLLQRVDDLAMMHNAVGAWVTVAVRPNEGTYAAYFGLVRTLGLKRSVPMTLKARACYDPPLVSWESDPRIVPDLSN